MDVIRDTEGRWTPVKRCRRDHLLTPDNVIERPHGRTCRTCWNERARARYQSKPRPRPTHCHKGHEFTPENTTLRANGSRACRRCARERTKAWRLAKSRVDD